MPDRNARIQLLVGLVFAILASALIVPRIEFRAIELVLPLIAVFAVWVAFATALQRFSHGALQYCELGLVFSAIVLLYTAYPLLSFLFKNQAFTSFDDVRLFVVQPTSTDIATVGWHYVVFLGCFAIAYLVSRQDSTRHRITLAAPRIEVIGATVLLMLFAQIFFLGTRIFFGSVDTDGYGAKYLSYLHMPRIVHQIANHLEGAMLVLNLLLLSALMARWRQARIWIITWLVIEVIIAVLVLGSRTRLFLLLMGFALNYHYLVRPLSLRSIVLSGLAGLLFFLALGVLRAIGSAAGEEFGGFFAGGTEFESLFVNAIDLTRLKENGLTTSIVPVMYFADLMRLVPQQLLPWDKLDLADWYVGTFYPDYAKIGGGLAFGVVAESVVGAGEVDLMWRGLVIGALFGIAQRLLGQGQVSFRRFVLYLWIILLSYQTLRSTTFTLVPLFVYQFLPMIIAVELLSRLLRVVITSRRSG